MVFGDNLGCTDEAPRPAHPCLTRRDAATREGRRRPRVHAASCHVAIPESGRRRPTQLKSAPTRPKSGQLGPYRSVSACIGRNGRVRPKFKKKKIKHSNIVFVYIMWKSKSMLSNILNIYCKNIFNNFLIAESCCTRTHLFQKLPSPAPAPALAPEFRNAPVLHRSLPKKWYIYDTTFKIRLTHIMLFVCHKTMIHMKWNVEAGSIFHCFYKDCI